MDRLLHACILNRQCLFVIQHPIQENSTHVKSAVGQVHLQSLDIFEDIVGNVRKPFIASDPLLQIGRVFRMALNLRQHCLWKSGGADLNHLGVEYRVDILLEHGVTVPVVDLYPTAPTPGPWHFLGYAAHTNCRNLVTDERTERYRLGAVIGHVLIHLVTNDEQIIYLNGHDEIHSLSKNINANNIHFWMGFSDHYINCFTVLKNIGLLSEQPVTTAEGQEIVPLKVVKACLPDPASLAPDYTGKTCIGSLIKGKKEGKNQEVFIYNISDHKKCYEEVESQAISYTAGVPPVAAAILIANGVWDIKQMVNVEQLDPDPFIDLLNNMGLTTKIQEK